MTLYARSDILETNISQVHGGCGRKHVRPTKETSDTELVDIWEIECPTCAEALKEHPDFAGTTAKIPETPDEKADREEQEGRGQRETTAATAASLAKISELPELFRQMPGMFAQFAVALNAQNGVIPGAAVQCGSGHAAPAGSVFCPQCGERMAHALGQVGPAQVRLTQDALPEDALKAAELIARNEAAPATGDLADKSMAELRAIAQAHGVATTRSKAEQLALLRAVGVE